jgi:hypothetical protein
MADLTHLANELDSKKGICRAIIETPKGSRNKFDYDEIVSPWKRRSKRKLGHNG